MPSLVQRRTLASALAVALAFGTAACGGPMADAEWLFDAGRYPQAKQALAALEGASASWDDSRRAEYALYRGLTLGALGDWGRAARWLAAAKAIEDARPCSLSRVDALRLYVVLASRP